MTAATIGPGRAVEVLHDRGPAMDVDRWTGGSGYLIGGRLVLTAAHTVDYRQVVGEDEQLLVRTIEGSELTARTVLVCDEPSGSIWRCWRSATLGSVAICFLSSSPRSTGTARRQCQAAGRSGFPGSVKPILSCRGAAAVRPGKFAARSCREGSCERGCWTCR